MIIIHDGLTSEYIIVVLQLNALIFILVVHRDQLIPPPSLVEVQVDLDHVAHERLEFNLQFLLTGQLRQAIELLSLHVDIVDHEGSKVNASYDLKVFLPVHFAGEFDIHGVFWDRDACLPPIPNLPELPLECVSLPDVLNSPSHIIRDV